MTEDAEAFAGPGGWDIAAAQLGIHLKGLEWDSAACATAQAAGFVRLQLDVASAQLSLVFPNGIRLMIQSPPCQAFSAAGKGKGRAGAAYILMGVQLMAWGNDPAQVCKWVDEQLDDPRAALVLEPLRWVLETMPETIALEQVPAVLPLWEAMAEVFRNLGYSVWTGNLYAEQYDTPQTRKRAILIGSRVRQVSRPAPVRRRYRKDRATGKTNRYTEFKLDEPGLKPWISMADALHRGLTERPSYTVCAGGTDTGGAEPFGNGARQQMRTAIEAGDWQLRMNSAPHAAVRGLDEPSSTVFFGERVNRAEWQQRSNYNGPTSADGERERLRRDLDEPSSAVTSKPWHWERMGDVKSSNGTVRDTDHPAATITSSMDNGNTRWTDADGVSDTAVRVTVQEAAVLQGFPASYPWQGKKGEQHRQVGDAIPPPLAWHVLRAALGLPVMHYPGTEDL